MEKIKRTPIFGQWISCTAYIEHSHNHYEIYPEEYTQDHCPECVFWAAGSNEGVDVEDFHECERFKTVNHEFEGIFVGFTVLNTKILAEYCDDPYSKPCYRTQTTTPEKFAIVYYGNNRKRIVPLGAIRNGRGEN
jgi:hypothetical protein